MWAYIKGIGTNIVDLFNNIGKVIAGALTFDLDKLKEGLSGVKNTISGTFTQIGTEVSKNAKEAAEEISKNFTEALDSTVNGHLEKKTPEQIKESLTSLGESLKETAKEAGKAVGLEFAEGVGEGSKGRKKAVALNIPQVGVSTDMGQNNGLNPIVPSIDSTQFDEGAAQMIIKLQEFNNNANNLISGSISNTFSNLGSSIGEALASGGDVLNAIGSTIIQGLSNFLSDMGSMLIKYGTLAVLKGKLDLAILAGGPVAIGAGIAAIAVGVALSAAGAAIGSFSSSGGGGQTGSSNFSGSSGGGNFGASSGGSGGGTVVFEIAGTKLVGVLSNTLRQNRDLGGTLSLTD